MLLTKKEGHTPLKEEVRLKEVLEQKEDGSYLCSAKASL